MQGHFDKPLYNQRWHAESGFSQHKRRLGAGLTARHDGAPGREIVLRVITHNLMLLAEAPRAIQQNILATVLGPGCSDYANVCRHAR